jgi:hypothetical protein
VGLTAVLMLLELMDFSVFLPIYVVACVGPKYLGKNLSALKMRAILTIPSCIYAYTMSECNIFLAFIPSLFFHMLTIVHWRYYALFSLPEVIICMCMASVWDILPIWMTMGFIICLLEKDKKYAWILLDSNRKSVMLVKGLFN